MSDNAQLTGLCDRFRGFYPVVIDVETAGFNAKTDALLEIAAITLKMDEQGWLMPDTTLHFHVEPFVGANLQPEALAFNGIDPNDPDRGAVSEYEALHEIFKVVRKGIKASGCNRAIMVAHNANFDHSFMMAAAERASLKRNPFHPFATFDTAALARAGTRTNRIVKGLPDRWHGLRQHPGALRAVRHRTHCCAVL